MYLKLHVVVYLGSMLCTAKYDSLHITERKTPYIDIIYCEY